MSGASAGHARRADIPPHAIRGFATVGSLVRSDHFAQHSDDHVAGKAPARKSSREQAQAQAEDDVTAAKKKPSKRAATASLADGHAKPKPPPRARKPKTTVTTTATLDPELRLPGSKVSPFFAANSVAEAATKPPNEPTDKVPSLTKSGKPRKPRAKKEKVEADEAIPQPKKTRVTKTKSAVKAQPEDACIESAHFHKPGAQSDGVAAGLLAAPKTTADGVGNTDAASVGEIPQSPKSKKKRAPKQRPPEQIVESLDLDEAVSRRRDWTPPRDTVIADPFASSAGKENKQVDADTNSEQFTHMISNFAYAQALPAQVASAVADSTATTTAVSKRRRVELVDVPGNQTKSRNSSPEKGKAPKKKARTITDIATEQYQPAPVQLGPSDLARQFFRPRTAVTKVPLNDVPKGDALPKKPSRQRPRSETASENGKVGLMANSKKASAKTIAKPKPTAEKLLSPNSALMRVNEQDILFGTSSQLALQESPTFVRQIQFALKESEVDADTCFNETLAPLPRWPKLEKVIGRRGLWDASSRDADGGLLEHREDVYVPEFDRTQDVPLLMDGLNDMPDTAALSAAVIDKADATEHVVISSDIPTPPPSTSQVSQTGVVDFALDAPNHVMEGSPFEDIDDFDCEPPPSNQNHVSQDSFLDIDDILPASVSLSTSALPKPRPPASASPKKYRGRPSNSQSMIPSTSVSPALVEKRKAAKARAPGLHRTPTRGSERFIDIDEILDSEDEAMQALSPIPPRIRSFQNSEPLPLFPASPSCSNKPKSRASVDPNIVRVHIVPSAHLEWSIIKSTVFSSITSHILSLSPTRDPLRPSWHERILMYDPIVIEDFTAYLNTNTNIRTWKRATKIQAKAWNKELKATGNEAVGIIEGGEHVLAVEKYLEAWQCQAWCESMSICCIWVQGRGRGGARKGFY